jgi:hypothetical protein
MYAAVQETRVMIGIAFICLAFLAISLGTACHFWILAHLENAGIKVKYFANVNDSLHAYGTYRQLAEGQRWPLWPGYVVFAAHVGVLIAGLTFLVDSPLPTIARLFR